MNHFATQIPDSILQALQYVVDLPQHGLLRWVKIIFLSIVVLAIFGIIRFYMVSNWLQERYGIDLAQFFRFGREVEGVFGKRWQEIKKKAQGDEASQKLAVIEAEEFLEEFLRRRDIKGKTLPEKLANVGAEVLPKDLAQDLQQAWQVVNNIISNPDYKLPGKAVERLLAIYERALKELSELGS